MTDSDEKWKGLAFPPLTGLVAIIITSLIILILINFYSLRMMSAMRAYINGESSYSKGEKNASQNLITYINTQDTVEWNEFLENIKIPTGDRIAREGLLNGASLDLVREGFLQGGNHPDDIGNMIWLFKTFQANPLMREPIKIWSRGDSLILQKDSLAHRIKYAITHGTIQEEKNYLLSALKENMMQLTIEEQNFSNTLGRTARRITNYLFLANVFLTLIIIGAVSFYIFKLLKNISQRNRDLANANKELDRLVYTISHDLRSPINSMMGLVGLAQRETNMDQMSVYLKMMDQSLKKLETFVRETIEMSKENRSEVKKEIVDLSLLVEQVISLHRHIPEAAGIRFSTEIGVYRVFSDRHKLEIILGNLISNAIKYHDRSKHDKFIKVTTASEMDKVRIEVTDNGIGIDSDDQAKVFNMFYMSAAHEKGSGLGLYIVNEMVTKLGGQVLIRSKLGEGSTFSVVLSK